MKNQVFPQELDTKYYKGKWPRLSNASDETVSIHYNKYRDSSGVPGSKFAYREHFITLFKKVPSLLEIGPYNKPIATGRHVKYFDILDKAGLDALAKSGTRIAKGPAPKIDYVSETGDLSVVKDTFEGVVSSHCIEHQPDLIKHLQDVGSVLDEGGAYFLLCPDKRFCFDHFIPETDFASVLQAHEEKRKVHSLESVLRQSVMSTHNNCGFHWAGKHGNPDLNSQEKFQQGLDRFNEANGAYIDVHAWRFTPSSFRAITQLAFDLGLSSLKPVRVFDTPKLKFEFAVILQKSTK